MIIKCESLMNMTQITRAMVPMNLALAVVLEHGDLTVGGLINGSGLEGRLHTYLVSVAKLEISDRGSKTYIPKNFYTKTTCSPLLSEKFGGLAAPSRPHYPSPMFGLFADTVVACVIILANGRVVRATKDSEYFDIFYAIPWSQGTLGLLTCAKIKLVQIKECVKLN
ncbi:putative delta(24)-sterol reductase [Helianthus debilis subsp. tardiflorus]